MSDTITMTIPALRPYLRLPRVAIAGIATRSGFSVDEVEDLRLAIGEVCLSLLDEEGGDGKLVIVFDVGSRGAMTVDVTATATAAPAAQGASELSDGLIAGTVGGVRRSDDGRTVTFDKVADEQD